MFFDLLMLFGVIGLFRLGAAVRGNRATLVDIENAVLLVAEVLHASGEMADVEYDEDDGDDGEGDDAEPGESMVGVVVADGQGGSRIIYSTKDMPSTAVH